MIRATRWLSVLLVLGSQVWEEEYKEKYEEPKWAGKLKQLSSEDKKTDSAPAVSCAKPGTEVKKAVLVKTKGKAAPESSEFMITVADVIKDREWYGHLKSFTNLDDKELMEQKVGSTCAQSNKAPTLSFCNVVVPSAGKPEIQVFPATVRELPEESQAGCASGQPLRVSLVPDGLGLLAL